MREEVGSRESGVGSRGPEAGDGEPLAPHAPLAGRLAPNAPAPNAPAPSARLPTPDCRLPTLRIVCLGGGTGLPTVLRGLAAAGGGLAITAVVAVSDDGGSSGRLRRQVGMLPPGDIRNCLVALGDGKSPLNRLFQYRFRGGVGIAGHTVGNLVLAALAKRSGDFLEAVRLSAEMLGVRGQVLPASLRAARLAALLDDGRLLEGERHLRRAGGRIRRLELRPAPPPAAPGVLEAIEAADLLVLGPGSIFSSVLATLLVEGVAGALRRARGLRVLVGNLMAEPGEAPDLDGASLVRVLFEHVGPVVDCLLANSRLPDAGRLERYRGRGATPLRYEREGLLAQGVVPIEADVLKLEGTRIRHDPRKLAGVLLGLAGPARREGIAPA